MEECSGVTLHARKVLLESWRQKKGSELETQILTIPDGEDSEAFIQARVESKWIHFSKKPVKRPNKTRCNGELYLQYRCRRWRKKHSERSTIPVECKAYVVFKVVDHPVLGRVAMERVNDVHTNHEVTDLPRNHVCKDLERKIFEWFDMDAQNNMILIKAHEWAAQQGYTDLKDTRYFVTPEQVRNLRKRFMRALRKDDSEAGERPKKFRRSLKAEGIDSQRRKKHVKPKQMDENDRRILHRLVTDVHSDDIIYYQPFVFEEQDLILVLQTEDMRADMEASTSKMLFIDSTNCVNKYGFPLWTLIMTNRFGRGVPVAHLIISSDNQSSLKFALTALKEKRGLDPRTIMVDKEYKVIGAAEVVFPEADILLCYFSVLQTVHRWMISKTSSLNGGEKGPDRNVVVHFFARLRKCSTEEEFNAVSEEFRTHFNPNSDIVRYFERNWFPIRHMWTQYGRKHSQENTNSINLAERFFMRLKHQFYSGNRNRRKKCNRRMDDLVRALLKKSADWISLMQNLQDFGQVQEDKLTRTEQPAMAAHNLIDQGWQDKVINIQNGNYIVPSEFDKTSSYLVNIPDCECLCENSKESLMCKHIQVVRLLQQRNPLEFGTLDGDLGAGAQQLIQTPALWHIQFQEGSIVFPDPDLVRDVVATSESCTCRAFTFFVDCSHVRLAQMVLPQQEVRVHQLQIEASPNAEPTPRNEGIASIKKDVSLAMLKRITSHFEKPQGNLSLYEEALIKRLHDDVFTTPIQTTTVAPPAPPTPTAAPLHIQYRVGGLSGLTSARTTSSSYSYSSGGTVGAGPGHLVIAVGGQGPATATINRTAEEAGYQPQGTWQTATQQVTAQDAYAAHQAAKYAQAQVAAGAAFAETANAANCFNQLFYST